ncbi:MAG: hypothetical protein JZU63_07140 [Rhodoferax sp.]|nr:hypothetical protein [Rhodoferax sp.]
MSFTSVRSRSIYRHHIETGLYRGIFFNGRGDYGNTAGIAFNQRLLENGQGDGVDAVND